MDTPSPKSRLVALVLVIFLGMFGAHRFYAGKTGSAIAQLILTLTFFGMIVSGIWVFIDFLLILFGGFADGKGAKMSDWNGTALSAPTASGVGVADELAKYADLKQKGMLTDEEYEAKKKQLLNA